MRKNFLILMLMALLPLAGWAQIDLADAVAGIAPIGYGTTTLPDPTVRLEGNLTKGTDYTIDPNFYTDATFATVKTAADGTTPLTVGQLPAGTWYIKIAAKEGTAYTGTKAIALTVNKKAVTATLGTALTKVYGAENPALLASNINWSSTDFVNDDNKDVFTGTYDYTLSSENVGTQTINVTGLTADNYTLSITGNFTITAKPITAEMITAVALSDTYKGAAFTTFAVDVKDGATALVAGTDFEVKAYTAENLSGTAVEPTDVGTYYLAIENKASVNYSVDTHLAAGTFVVNRAGLRIAGKTLTKVYDGTTALPAGETYTVTGLQGTDNINDVIGTGTDNKITTALNTGENANASTTAKVVKVTATSNGGKIGNYDVNIVNGSLTITKRPITITVKAATKKYNTADADATGYNASWPASIADLTAKGDIAAKGYSGVTVGYTGDDTKAPFATGEAIKFFGEYKTSSPNNGYAGYYVKRTNTDELKGNYTEVLDLVATHAQATLTGNYDITIVKGNYSITGGKIYITAEAKTKEYGDADPELTYTVDGLSGTETLVTEPTLTREGAGTTAGEDVKDGGYTINLAGAVAPEGYEDIVYGTAKLTITKAPLTVSLPIQTLATSINNETDALAALDKTGITVEGFKKDETAASSYTLSMKSDISYGSDATIADGYTLTLTDAIKANYQIKTGEDTYADNISGKVVIGNGTAEAVNFTSVDADKATIAARADETQTVTIKFGPRNARKYAAADTDSYSWKAGKWTTMVLPFDISVSDLSRTLGYAIVNVIDPTRTTVSGDESKFYGKLTMKGGNGSDEVLKANKPFLLKVADNITDAAYNFGSKKIVAADDLSVDAGGNCKFVGTYTTKTVTKDDDEAIWFMNGDEDGWQFIGSSSTATWSIVPFEAYIDMSAVPAAARNMTFYVEDIDGSVTAIKGISADAAAKAKVAEGWYTINGVKLNAAPTQKGIYINNGKKFVVK